MAHWVAGSAVETGTLADDGSSGGGGPSGPSGPGGEGTRELLAAACAAAGLLAAIVTYCVCCRRCCRGPTPQPGTAGRAGGHAAATRPAPPPPPPLPSGLVLAVSVPKVVSQTYLCFSVAGGSADAPESVRWTVQKRCSQFEELAFSGALQARVVADPALASLTWPPRGRTGEDPRQMELRRDYADRWAEHLCGPGGLAWDTQVFRDFVALDEHIHQLQGVLDAEAGVVAAAAAGPSGRNHQQYATDSGLFDAGLQQRLLDTSGKKGGTRRV